MCSYIYKSGTIVGKVFLVSRFGPTDFRLSRSFSPKFCIPQTNHRGSSSPDLLTLPLLAKFINQVFFFLFPGVRRDFQELSYETFSPTISCTYIRIIHLVCYIIYKYIYYVFTHLYSNVSNENRIHNIFLW